jgi:hypothetical protein
VDKDAAVGEEGGNRSMADEATTLTKNYDEPGRCGSTAHFFFGNLFEGHVNVGAAAGGNSGGDAFVPAVADESTGSVNSFGKGISKNNCNHCLSPSHFYYECGHLSDNGPKMLPCDVGQTTLRHDDGLTMDVGLTTRNEEGPRTTPQDVVPRTTPHQDEVLVQLPRDTSSAISPQDEGPTTLGTDDGPSMMMPQEEVLTPLPTDDCPSTIL